MKKVFTLAMSAFTAVLFFFNPAAAKNPKGSSEFFKRIPQKSEILSRPPADLKEGALYQVINLVDEGVPEANQWLAAVGSLVFPIEASRASGFIVRFPESISNHFVSVAHGVSKFVPTAGHKKDKPFGVGQKGKTSKKKPIQIPLNGIDEHLRVVDSDPIATAELLFVPEQHSLNDMLHKNMPGSLDFSVSRLVEPANIKPMPIRETPIKPNEEIYILGFPGITRDARQLAISRGKVLDSKIATSRIKKWGFEMDAHGAGDLIFSDAASLPGLSGGIVVDKDGSIVGVLQGGYFPDGHPVNAMKNGQMISQIVSIKAIQQKFFAESAEQ